MRQQTIFKKMAVNLRHKTLFAQLFASTNSLSAAWADSTVPFTNSSRKGLLICTSNLQVLGCHLQVEFTSAFYKLIHR
jgi:hypothetical protein